jgi:hydroxymethylbilane synthase
MSIEKIRIGSRGSDLALWQAKHVQALIYKHYPDVKVEIAVIHTTGDRVLDQPLNEIGGKGLFTKEIENALLANEVDLAVHSLKDLPTEIDRRLKIAAIPERASVEDVFLSRDKDATLVDLPDGATVATGSLRRRAQLLSERPDLNVVDIRGNVPTRIKKLLDSSWDGMILAAAGVERLGLMEHVRHKISTEWILPAVGQGALAIQTREQDAELIELLSVLNDAETEFAVTAERALLNEMGGGCQVPIGAYAQLIGGTLELAGAVAHPDGTSVIKGRHAGAPEDAERIGKDLAETLLNGGGREILDFVFRLQTPSSTVDTRPEA